MNNNLLNLLEAEQQLIKNIAIAANNIQPDEKGYEDFRNTSPEHMAYSNALDALVDYGKMLLK